jgi:transcriptional regulator with XRE-family HTH domain
MLIYSIMNERIREFLLAENKSSAQLAEEIGVQPSGISHILSGRNNPSLDFVLKMLEKYPSISTDWLLFGKGSMYKDNKSKTLFDGNSYENAEGDTLSPDRELSTPESESPEISINSVQKDMKVPERESLSAVEKIVWFYYDKSFKEYFPGK